ncbi:MAG: Y-family DNA polymerase [Gemmatimonadaceae bacterium]
MSAPPRRILLADADAFFVAVARLVDPQGVGREPLLIVGGTRQSRGVVCSASYETRAYGVRSAMPIARALRLCPQAVCVPVPRKACQQKSGEIRQVLERFAPVVEGASIDEWYLDLAGTESLYRYEPLAETAGRIRAMICRDTGLSVSFGGGTSKLVAKLAVERAKPKPGNDATGVHVVPPGDEAGFLRGFALADLPMVGPRFQERLATLGMRTVPDVLQYDAATLTRWIGAREAAWLYERVRGVDGRAVAPRLETKSISRDETFPQDIADDAALRRELAALVARAASDLRAEGLSARTVTVRIRDHEFRTRSAGRTVGDGVVSDRVILAIAGQLFARLRAGHPQPARLLGVALTSLAEDQAADQLSLFEREAIVETDRDRAVSRAIDQVRARFGPDGIVPGGR